MFLIISASTILLLGNIHTLTQILPRIRSENLWLQFTGHSHYLCFSLKVCYKDFHTSLKKRQSHQYGLDSQPLCWSNRSPLPSISSTGNWEKLISGTLVYENSLNSLGNKLKLKIVGSTRYHRKYGPLCPSCGIKQFWCVLRKTSKVFKNFTKMLM